LVIFYDLIVIINYFLFSCYCYYFLFTIYLFFYCLFFFYYCYHSSI